MINEDGYLTNLSPLLLKRAARRGRSGPVSRVITRGIPADQTYFLIYGSPHLSGGGGRSYCITKLGEEVDDLPVLQRHSSVVSLNYTCKRV